MGITGKSVGQSELTFDIKAQFTNLGTIGENLNLIDDALATKQNIINDGDLSISKISTLQTVLDSKASNQDLSDGLSTKQNVINDGDLSISKIATLQTVLDSKASNQNLSESLKKSTEERPKSI